MSKVQLATRIDPKVKSAMDEVCQQKGIKLNYFVETAILEKLEELQDIVDLKKISKEPTRPLSHVLKDLGLNEEI